MEIEELTVSDKDGNLIVHVFEDNGEVKAIVNDDYILNIKNKAPSK